MSEDYLDEDKPIKNQLYCCLSLLTPNSFPENVRDTFKNTPIMGIKVRGVYATVDEAQKRATYLQKVDKIHHIFVGEVGKWLPFDVDTNNMSADNQVYREKQLNDYMKSYRDALDNETKEEQTRKSELTKDAKIVHDKSDIPKATGLGTGNLENHSIDYSKLSNNETNETNETNENNENNENNETNELETVKNDKRKIEENLNVSKSNLENLSEKMKQIDIMFKDLQKKK
jgi:hypothetical protein